MTLDNMVGRGLERADTDNGEISRYLAKIRRRIADAKKTAISLDSRFDIAFEALLLIALAALRANGYRTTSEAGHQRLAIQLLPKSIGIEPVEIRTLDEYRKKRSIGVYEADFDPSSEEVKAVTQSVRSLLGKLEVWIRKHRPDLGDQPAASPAPAARVRSKFRRRRQIGTLRFD
jgi:hypothetical protein